MLSSFAKRAPLLGLVKRGWRRHLTGKETKATPQ
jgi:hypothetical protein